MNDKNTGSTEKLTHVVATFSITMTGEEGQAPLVASRVTIDGKQVEVPFVLVMGQGEQPLVVISANMVQNRIDLARTLSEVSANLTTGVLKQVTAAIQKLAKGSGEQSPDHSSHPQETTS